MRSFFPFFTLTLTLIIIPILFWIIFSTIKFPSTFKWNRLCKFFWLIYSFYHIKYFQIDIFYFTGHKHFTKWIFGSISNSITLVLANDKWIVMEFIRTEIDKHWSDHARLVVYGYTFYGQWSKKTLQHQYQNNKRLLNESRHLYNFVFQTKYFWMATILPVLIVT